MFLLAARFPDPPAGEMFLSLAQGELHALRLLADFAAALGWGERDLRAYEPRPLAQAYPAYLAWSALFGTRSGVASVRVCRPSGSRVVGRRQCLRYPAKRRRRTGRR